MFQYVAAIRRTTTIAIVVGIQVAAVAVAVPETAAAVGTEESDSAAAGAGAALLLLAAASSFCTGGRPKGFPHVFTMSSSSFASFCLEELEGAETAEELLENSVVKLLAAVVVGVAVDPPEVLVIFSSSFLLPGTVTLLLDTVV